MPDTSLLEIEYPTFRFTLKQNLLYIARGIGRFALLMLVLTVLEYFVFNLRPAPYFHAILTVSAVLVFFFCYLVPLGRWDLWFVAVFVVPLIALLLFSFPSPLLISLAAVLALCLVSDAIAWNYFFLKTAAPVLKPTSVKLRHAWSRRFFPWGLRLEGAELYILPFAVATVGLLAVILFCEITPPEAIFLRYGAFFAYFILLFFLPLALELLFSLYRKKSPVLPSQLLPAVFYAIYQWLTYNRHDNQAPGIFQSPFGYFQFRQYALLATSTLLALALFHYLNPHHARFVWHPDEPASAAASDYLAAESDAPAGQAITEEDLAPHQQRIYENLSEDQKAEYLQDLEEDAKLAQAKPARVYPPPPTKQELRQTWSFGTVSSFFFSWLGWLSLLVAPTITTFLTVFFFVYATTTRISSRFDYRFNLEQPTIELDHNTWEGIVYNLRLSRDPIESSSIFVGLNAGDGTPVIVPRKVFQEHAHFLGDSGSGKTSLGLAPLISQLIRSCDSTVVVLDLKGDDRALFENVRIEAEALDSLLKRAYPNHPQAQYPFRWLTTDTRCSTFAFNPLTQSHFDSLTDYQKTDIIMAGLAMDYGTDYGRGYYSDANSHLLHEILTQIDPIESFEQIAQLMQAKPSPIRINHDLRRAASHVVSHMSRLASFEFLNVTRRNASPEVLENTVDLTDLFRRPQALFLNLPVGQGAVSSAHIARLFIHSLLSAADHVGSRRRQVYLVIDEFQRIAAHNIKTLLQTARSMNIAVILANQSLADLKTADTDLVPTIRTNTRFRQVFAASDLNERRDLVDGSGEALFLKRTWTEMKLEGLFNIRRSVSFSETIGPRLRQNDILLATDHPHHSILEIRRGSGYAQYGGFPFVATSMFHISEPEYNDRRREPWPESVPGTLPDNTPPASTVIHDIPRIAHDPAPKSDSSDANIDDSLDSLWGDK